MADLLTDQALLAQNPEAADLSRQRKLAEMLTLQAFQQPQGNLVSGRYVAPSWTQQLAPLVSGIAGQAMNKQLDEKQLALADALRQKQVAQIEQFGELQKTDPDKALRMALASDNPILRDMAKEELKGVVLPEGAVYSRKNLSGGVTEMKGNPKYHAPTSVDMGTLGTMLIYPDGRREMVQKGRESPAGQVVETANGPMLVNTRTGQAQPIMGAGGQPLAPKLNPDQSKDITAINQQISTIDGAIEAIKKNPKVFSYARGFAGDMPKGETISARYQSPDETSARSYVFNNVSAVIKERAGTAQSIGEAKRLSAFLPDTYDDAQTIINKFNGFKTYLKDLEKGTRQNPNISMQQPSVAQPSPSTQQFDPKLLQYMTPEQQALFAKPGN